VLTLQRQLPYRNLAELIFIQMKMSNFQTTSPTNGFEKRLIGGFFARHETFCPRYGWLKKGFDQVAGYNGHEPDGEIFNRNEAIEKLGVGKNMVRSIRFWCLAFKIIEPENTSKTSRLSGPMKPTRFGKLLLSDNGWDPYLEDPASLWLLHWKLFTEPNIATAWSLIVNTAMNGSFSMQDLERVLIEQKEKNANFKRYSNSSIKKDASCFIRMYSPPGTRISEEIECPFTHLGLLLNGDRPKSYRFNFNEKTTLPDKIFLAACFEYSSQYSNQTNSISLSRLSYGFNSPGMAFKISESDIGNRLDRSIPSMKGVEFTESYGNRQLQFEQDPKSLYWYSLNHYYERNFQSLIGK